MEANRRSCQEQARDDKPSLIFGAPISLSNSSCAGSEEVSDQIEDAVALGPKRLLHQALLMPMLEMTSEHSEPANIVDE